MALRRQASAPKHLLQERLKPVPRRELRLLAEVAASVSPEDPQAVIEDPDVFLAAARSILAPGLSTLRLRYSDAKRLAVAAHRMGFERPADPEQPLRFAWVGVGEGESQEAVVLAATRDTITLILPPRAKLQVPEDRQLTIFSQRGSEGLAAVLVSDVRLHACRCLVLNVVPSPCRASGRSSSRKRVDCRMDFTVSVATHAVSNVEQHTGRVFDLSLLGIGFQGGVELDPGDRLHMDIHLEDAEDSPLCVSGAVTWWDDERDDGLDTGLVFDPLIPSKRQRLERYLGQVDVGLGLSAEGVPPNPAGPAAKEAPTPASPGPAAVDPGPAPEPPLPAPAPPRAPARGSIPMD